MTVVIGLHGKKKSGKTTFEGVARNIFPFYRLECIAFADALKECCKYLAYKNKDCFDTQQGKGTVLSNVQINLTEVCFDIVSFGFGYENCKQLGLYPINCMLKLQQVIRQTFPVKDLANGQFQDIDFGGITAGRLLQIMGTDICRNHIHPQLWVNIIKNKILSLNGRRDVILVTDVREINEYEMLQSLETRVIRIQRTISSRNSNIPKEYKLSSISSRDDKLFSERISSWSEGDRLENHSSEVALDEVSMHTILNNGTLEEFQLAVKDFLIEFVSLLFLP